jgi:hypothetical protein
MTRYIKLTVLLIMFSVLIGCSSTGEQKKLVSLNDAIDEYAYAMRFGRIDDAVSYHINEEGIKPDIDLSIMNSIRVTGFSIKERTVNPEQTEATVESEFNYYHDQYGTLRTLEYSQHWWYEPGSNRWFLDSEFPPFR